MARDAFGCKAPLFIDFSKLSEPEDKARIEAYFENNENDISNDCESDDGEVEDVEFYTPMHNTDLKSQGRLSISMVCLSQMDHYEDEKVNEEANISDSVKSINLNNDNENAAPKKPAASRSRSTARITPKLNKSASLRARSNSGTRWNSLAQPKETQSKYVSMKEAVHKFERLTPSRFHSKPKGTICSTEKLNGPIASTIPYSPALATKVRQRPTTVISSTDLELRQFEEAKKFKIKANPVNRKVLGPIKPIQPIRKSPTHPEPFNITTVPKKAPPPVKNELKEFHARPAPDKSAVFKLAAPKHTAHTLPITPNVMKHPTRRVQPPVQVAKPAVNTSESKCGKTKVEPFSFEQRDKMKQMRKERMREAQLEEERKLREFHSRPMPAKIYKEPSLPVKLTKRAESMESVKSGKGEDQPKPFKARPPISLMKEPFIPKKSDRPLIEISQFDLNVEKRLRQREKFDEMIKEKERYLENEQQLRQEAERQLELEEIRKQRQQSIHNARPIAKFKDLPVVQPKPATIPVTPQLCSRYKNKENLAQPLRDSYED